MGIYIQGMEMPTEEEIGRCIIVRHDGEVLIVEFDNLVDGGFVACYPTNPMRAIPVPPHGDLIDRTEAIVDTNERAYDFWSSDFEVDETVRFLNEQASIIPAEERKENNHV